MHEYNILFPGSKIRTVNATGIHEFTVRQEHLKCVHFVVVELRIELNRIERIFVTTSATTECTHFTLKQGCTLKRFQVFGLNVPKWCCNARLVGIINKVYLNEWA